MKKFCLVLLTVLTVLQLFSCGSASNGKTSEKELYKAGLDLVDTMDEMIHSEAYIELMGSGDAISKVTDNVDTYDYSTPSAVYKISTCDITDYLRVLGKGNDDAKLWNMLSDNLKEQLEHKFSFSSVISIINGRQGAAKLAFSSLYTAQVFDDSIKVDETTVFLYVYEEGIPIAVIFEERGIVRGQFVFLDDATTPSSVKRVFEQLKCSVAEVNLK